MKRSEYSKKRVEELLHDIQKHLYEAEIVINVLEMEFDSLNRLLHPGSTTKKMKKSSKYCGKGTIGKGRKYE